MRMTALDFIPMQASDDDVLASCNPEKCDQENSLSECGADLSVFRAALGGWAPPCSVRNADTLFTFCRGKNIKNKPWSGFAVHCGVLHSAATQMENRQVAHWHRWWMATVGMTMSLHGKGRHCWCKVHPKTAVRHPQWLIKTLQARAALGEGLWFHTRAVPPVSPGQRDSASGATLVGRSRVNGGP